MSNCQNKPFIISLPNIHMFQHGVSWINLIHKFYASIFDQWPTKPLKFIIGLRMQKSLKDISYRHTFGILLQRVYNFDKKTKRNSEIFKNLSPPFFWPRSVRFCPFFFSKLSRDSVPFNRRMTISVKLFQKIETSNCHACYPNCPTISWRTKGRAGHSFNFVWRFF